MAEAPRIIGAFAAGLVVTWLAAPVAASLAVRTGFCDHPGGYKKHNRPTPYLGGMAVVAGFLAAALVFTDGLSNFRLPVACALSLLALGTLDDRINLGIAPRLALEVGVAAVLWAGGQGWEVVSADWVNLAITIFWVVGLINAFNLMDNLDGAAATVALTSAVGAGVLALTQSDALLAAVCFSLAGACAGFLPHNLARPSRIFLGDGGSMPIGFILAAATMALPLQSPGGTAIAVSALLVGLPLLDMAVVIVSRRRRGVGVLRGGRDHMTHRLFNHLGSEREVAGVLVLGQGALCVIAGVLYHNGNRVVVLSSAALVLVAAAIVLVAIDPLARFGRRFRRDKSSPPRSTRGLTGAQPRRWL